MNNPPHTDLENKQLSVNNSTSPKSEPGSPPKNDKPTPKIKLKKNGQPDRRYSSNKEQISNTNNKNYKNKRKAEEISPNPTDPITNNSDDSELLKTLKNSKLSSNSLNLNEKPCLIDLKSLLNKRDQLLLKLTNLETKISTNQDSANQIEKEAQNILRETEELETLLVLQESCNPSENNLEAGNTHDQSDTIKNQINPPLQGNQASPSNTHPKSIHKSDLQSPISNSHNPHTASTHNHTDPHTQDYPSIPELKNLPTPDSPSYELNNLNPQFSLNNSTKMHYNTNETLNNFQFRPQHNLMDKNIIAYTPSSHSPHSHTSNNQHNPMDRNIGNHKISRNYSSYQTSRYSMDKNIGTHNTSHNYSQFHTHKIHQNPMDKNIGRHNSYPSNHPNNNTIKIFWKGAIITPTRKQLLTFKGRLDDIKRAIGYRDPMPHEWNLPIAIEWHGNTLYPTPGQLISAGGNLHKLQDMLTNEHYQDTEQNYIKRYPQERFFPY